MDKTQNVPTRYLSSLVSGQGSEDNDQFTILGENAFELQIPISLLKKPSSSTCPHRHYLGQSLHTENSKFGTRLGAIDQDATEHTFVIDHQDNGVSSLVVVAQAVFDYETKDAYTVHIQVIDAYGYTFKDLVVEVLKVRTSRVLFHASNFL